MKRVLLIGPHSSRHTNESRYMCPPLGITRIANYLQSFGHYAIPFDPNLSDIDISEKTVQEKLYESDWDIIGFSCLEETLVKDMENMWLAKKILPQAIIIAGGIESQYNYQTILDKSPCNIVIIGEGEKPMKDICDEMPVEKINGVIFKRKAVPLTKSEFQEVTDFVDYLEIPYGKYWSYYEEKYGDSITEEIKDQIYTIRVFAKSRCPFLCRFCSSTNQLNDACEKYVKPVGLEPYQLANMILRIKLSHPKTRTIYLTDDDFCLDKNFLIEFCRHIIDADLTSLKYMCFARSTDIDDEILGWMKKANFRRLNIGMESFSDNVLKEVNKRCTAEKNFEVLKLLREHSMKAFMTFMFITPGTTLEDMEITVSTIKEIINDPLFTFGLSLGVRPHKGSGFYETNCDFEMRITQLRYSEFIDDKPIYIKEHKMIYARDPVVKAIQMLYREREHLHIARYVAKQKVKHATFTNIAPAQIGLIQTCIDEIKQQHG